MEFTEPGLRVKNAEKNAAIQEGIRGRNATSGISDHARI